MRVLIFGGTGMLGHKLVQVLGEAGLDVFATIRGTFSSIEPIGIFERSRITENVDINVIAVVENLIEAVKPNVVINAVGIIKQLPTSNDVIATLSANSIFPHRLAGLAKEFGFRLITISTDCVFDGAAGNYNEGDPANALDLYGRSKNLGEVAAANCLTLRTSIIGREIGTAHSLVEWFLENPALAVKGYANAIYSGFPTVVFADILSFLIHEHTGLSGLYHVSSHPISKYDLLVLIRESFGKDIEIERFEDFHIDRSLDSSRFRVATGFTPDSWPNMIERMHSDPTPYDKYRK
ncbi:MAG: dTDP-4-dehydrorhamnose reductase family protein [Pyrinomonadaceae bacterium]